MNTNQVDLARQSAVSNGCLLLINDRKRKQFQKLAKQIDKPSSALERMKSFLPEIAAANAIMDSKVTSDPQFYNAENVEEVDGPIVEMNVSLVEMGEDSSSSEDSTDNEDDDDDDNNDDKPPNELTVKNFKIPRLQIMSNKSKSENNKLIEILP